MRKIKLLIVDDSKIIQRLLRNEFSKVTEFEIIGIASNPLEAFSILKKNKADVMLLDIEMPHMNGFEFLTKLNDIMYVPTIIVTGSGRSSMEIGVKAMEVGALDVYMKPSVASNIDILIDELKNKILQISKEKYRPKSAFRTIKPKEISAKNTVHNSSKKAEGKSRHVETVLTKKTGKILSELSRNIIAIGSSTGGVQALTEIIPSLPSNMPPILIVQHMPKGFTASFAVRLNGLSRLEVKEAKNGDRVKSGLVLLAPGGEDHMRIASDRQGYYVTISGGDKVNRHSPSVDVLFDSMAKEVGANTIAVILTGMGGDGAKGMKNISTQSKKLIVQDEASSTVFGMPRVALELNPEAKEVALEEISGALLDILKE